MKLTLQIMMALLAIAVLFGLVLPWLVSAKSTIAVIIAIVVLAVFILIAVHTITKLIGKK